MTVGQLFLVRLRASVAPILHEVAHLPTIVVLVPQALAEARRQARETDLRGTAEWLRQQEYDTEPVFLSFLWSPDDGELPFRPRRDIVDPGLQAVRLLRDTYLAQRDSSPPLTWTVLTEHLRGLLRAAVHPYREVRCWYERCRYPSRPYLWPVLPDELDDLG